MARPKQDPEAKRLKKEAKKELKRETYKSKVAWLNKEWQGPHWFPRDVTQRYKPCSSVVHFLKNITELAIRENILLHSLWESGGFIRNVVDQDLANRQHPASARLTKKMANKAYRDLVASISKVGNDGGSSPGSTTRDGYKSEAPEDEAVALQPTSPSRDPLIKQRLPSSFFNATTSTEDEQRVPSRKTKRPLGGEEDEASTTPHNKNPRLTMENVLKNLSSVQIENAQRILAVELDTALSAKHDAEKALLDLLHRDGSVAVSQAERVQARCRKQEAEATFHRVYGRLNRPNQTLATMANLKQSFDARAICAHEFERAQNEAQNAKNRLDQAQARFDAALKSDRTDERDLDVVWDMFMGSDQNGEESE
ncbi:hypothetical protein FGADI_5876 [Fusarium gaditjirri]|uniref:Uncharacterized protein n=1 Tax=Fusarium gaditjirri TaxID=282569 RepID=A0A8H4T943_9HYPO|nr:hypothetical protein FGADI_5876 [Fusarium gaditjirri]